MEMENEERAYRAHVLVLPYHGQGHMNPMLQFAKRLASQGIKITVVTTSSNVNSIQGCSDYITFESIYDDCAEGGVAGLGGFKGFLDRFEARGSKNLSKLIQEQKTTKYPVKCLVYDANITWTVDIATKMGIATAAFFTQSCAAIASYYPMHCHLSPQPVSLPDFPVTGIPKLRIPNLPSLGSDSGRYPPIILHILRQFDNIDKVDCVLFNSFFELEAEIVQWMSKLWRVRTIGPTVPSVYLDKRLETDNGYGFHIYKPNTETCLNWLNTQKTGSVVYISYGSAANLSIDQMEQIAGALRSCSSSFLWVVKPTEVSNLPGNFREETADQGIVVSWCPQLEVLAHPATGCFISHCGWNSTMEAISFGVPVVAMPQFLDQIINAHFLEQVWGVGLVPRADENGLTTSDEISRCIREVMQGNRGEEIRKNAIRWMALAREAIVEGGSSDKCILDFVSELGAA